MRCAWCQAPLASRRAQFCGRKCRQAAFRLRRRRTTEAALGQPGRFAYADPPYPGLSSKYYRDEHDFAGEVDHGALIASLEDSNYMGWALSTSAAALADILPLCPPAPTTRVCAWVKPIGVPAATNGLHNTWEPLIVVRGRQLPPGKRDWLRAQPARGGAGMERASLPGRKPIAFCAWLFDCLGMQPGDELDDLFPGSGVVTQAWASLAARANASPEYSADASFGDDADVSSTHRGVARSSSATSPAPGGVAQDLGDVSLTPRGSARRPDQVSTASARVARCSSERHLEVSTTPAADGGSR